MGAGKKIITPAHELSECIQNSREGSYDRVKLWGFDFHRSRLGPRKPNGTDPLIEPGWGVQMGGASSPIDNGSENQLAYNHATGRSGGRSSSWLDRGDEVGLYIARRKLLKLSVRKTSVTLGETITVVYPPQDVDVGIRRIGT